MKECPSCGAQMNDNVKFCPHCGSPAGPAPDAQFPSQEVPAQEAPAAQPQTPFVGADPYAQQPNAGAPYAQQPPMGAPYAQQAPQAPSYGYGYAPPAAVPPVAAAPLPSEGDMKNASMTAWIVFAVLTLLAIGVWAAAVFVPYIPGARNFMVSETDLDSFFEAVEEAKDKIGSEEFDEALKEVMEEDDFEVTSSEAEMLLDIIQKKNCSLYEIMQVTKIVKKNVPNIRSDSARSGLTIAFQVVQGVQIYIGVTFFLALLTGLLACITKNKALAIIYLILSIFTIVPLILDFAAGIVVLVNISRYNSIKNARRSAGLA